MFSNIKSSIAASDAFLMFSYILDMNSLAKMNKSRHTLFCFI